MCPVGKAFSGEWTSFTKTWVACLCGSEQLNHHMIGELSREVSGGQTLVRTWLFLWVPLQNSCWIVTDIGTVFRDESLKRWTGHENVSVLMSSPPEWVPDRRNDPHFLPQTHVCLLAPSTHGEVPYQMPAPYSWVPHFQNHHKWIFLLINQSLWYYLIITENGPGHSFK